MAFTLRVDKEFFGPSLTELEPILNELPDPVEVRWSGSRLDFLAFERTTRDIVMVVPDVEQAERTTWLLGGRLELPEEDLKAARKALTSTKDQTWRSRVEDLGFSRGALLLTKVTADAIRAGKTPKASTSIAIDCLLQKVHPADADVLLRLRVANPRML